MQNVLIYFLTIFFQFLLGASLWSIFDKNWLRSSAMSLIVVALVFHVGLLLSAFVYALTGLVISVSHVFLASYCLMLIYVVHHFKTKREFKKTFIRLSGAFLFFLFISLIFLRKFTNTYPDIEIFDFYNHWGYIVRRFVVSDVLTMRKNIFDWSMYEYPFLGASWVYLQSKLLDTDMLLRYRTFWMLALAFVFALSHLKQNKQLSLAFILTLLLIRYWEWNTPILGIGYTGLMDFTVGITLLWLCYSFILYLESKSRRDLCITIMLAVCASQFRIEGIFIFAATWGLLFLYSLRHDKIKRDLPIFITAGIVPTLWTFYEKTELSGLGHGAHFDVKAFQNNFIPYLSKIFTSLPWISSLFLVFYLCLLILTLQKKQIVRSLSYVSLPAVTLTVMYVIFYAGVWIELVEMPRHFGIIIPVFVFLNVVSIFYIFEKILPLRKIQRKHIHVALLGIGIVAGASDLRQFCTLSEQLNSYSSDYDEFPCLQKWHVTSATEPKWLAIQDIHSEFEPVESFIMMRLYLYPHFVAPVNDLSNDYEIRSEFEKRYMKMPKQDILSGELIKIDLSDCR